MKTKIKHYTLFLLSGFVCACSNDDIPAPKVDAPLHKTEWFYTAEKGGPEGIIESRVKFDENLMYYTVSKTDSISSGGYNIHFSNPHINPTTNEGREVLQKVHKIKAIYLNATKDTLFIEKFGTDVIYKHLGIADNFKNLEW